MRCVLSENHNGSSSLNLSSSASQSPDSLSTKQIHSELLKNNVNIDKKKIKLENPISSLGFHNVTIELRKDVSAKLNIQVVKE